MNWILAERVEHTDRLAISKCANFIRIMIFKLVEIPVKVSFIY